MSVPHIPVKDRRVRRVAYIAAPITAAIVGLFFIRGCHKVEPPAKEALFVPRDLARLKGLDAEGVLSYCRDEVRSANYPGVQRGGFGALWAGEGNAWDKALLAVAALDGKGIEARVVPGDPPRVALMTAGAWSVWRLDADKPETTTPNPPDGSFTAAELVKQRPDLFHTLTPVLTIERDGKAPERIEPAAPERLEEWAHEPVVVEAKTADGGLVYVLRVGRREVLRSGPLRDVKRASLALTWTFQDQSASWTRELFDRGNSTAEVPGQAEPRPGDRFVIAVAAGPLKPEVLKTRQRMMELSDYSPEPDEQVRRLVSMAVKYQVVSDDRTRAVARECEVQVSWLKPRLTVAAGGDKEMTLDTLADEVEAEGKRSREFHVARGLANDLIETRVIYEATRKPTISASTVLCQFKSDRPDAPARRIALIEKEARRMLANEPIGSATILTASPSPALSDEDRKQLPAVPPRLTIERTPGGLVLRGLARKGEIPKEEPWNGYDWDDKGAIPFANIGETAVILDGMLSHKSGRADNLLECQVDSAWPLRQLPVVQGSVLIYKARFQGKDSQFAVKVILKDGVPIGSWTESESGRQGQTTGGWPEAIQIVANQPELRAIVAAAPAAGEPVRHSLRIGLNKREVDGRAIDFPGGTATLLNDPRFPLILAWTKGDLSLSLESASPVIQGQVRDADSDRPAPADAIHARTLTVTERKPIDLRKWKQQGPKANGYWRVKSEGDMVEQRINGNPTFFVSPDDYIDTTIRGRISVHDADDDMIGFVFGYQSPIADKKQDESDYDFLLFDWKCRDQGPAREGFALSRVKGNFKNSDPEKDGFWDHKSTPKFQLLAADFGVGKGWRQNKEHEFELTYTRSRVKIAIDGKVIFDLKGTFPPGRFGFYNYSQPMVRYQGFSTYAERKVAVDQARTPTAADGSYALPIVAGGERLLLVLDRSGSMVFSLDPKDGTHGRKDKPSPPGQQRIDFVRKAVDNLLDQVPPAVEIGVWSFSSNSFGSNSADDDKPTHVRLECPYTTDHARVRQALKAIKPEGGTPLSGTVFKILEHLREDPRGPETTVVLMTDGENTGRLTPVAAYRQGNGQTPIHTIGFAIEPGGKAEQAMRDLAAASGGTFRIAGTGDALKLAFGRFARLPDALVRFESTCHAPFELTVPAGELGKDRQDVLLSHGCATCKCQDKTLLTITKASIGRLNECAGLSPKARRMIEERLADGKWHVIIPNRRVDIGPISAYGWWETETATGRMVGRTEDGLHGASAGGGGFPKAGLGSAGSQPFVAWYTGVVAYTTGSVLTAMSYHNEPGFFTGGPESFVRFVQANALDFCARWWNEVGSGAFPENIHSYWSGVCLNFTLQSLATRMPSLDCHRAWAKAICDQAAGAMKDLPGDKMKKQFGGDLNDLSKRLKNMQAQIDQLDLDPAQKSQFHDDVQQVLDGLNGLEESWSSGVDQGFDCSRFNRMGKGPAAKPQ